MVILCFSDEKHASSTLKDTFLGTTWTRINTAGNVTNARAAIHEWRWQRTMTSIVWSVWKLDTTKKTIIIKAIAKIKKIVHGLPDNVKKNSRTGKVGRETTCDHGKPTSRRSELQSIIKYKVTWKKFGEWEMEHESSRWMIWLK